MAKGKEAHKLNQLYMANRRGRTARTARRFMPMVLLVALTLLLATPLSASANPNGGTLPPLGTAGSFGVLAGSAVTNTGPTIVNGDLGVSPGTAVTGFPPGTVNGMIHAGGSVAAEAQNDATIAYNSAAGQACDSNLTGQDLGGMVLIPGVYCFDSSAQLTGQLTFDGQGNPDSVFIIQIGSTLTTASNAQVLTIGEAQPCRIFWQVGSSATLGTDTSFAGNILALTSITLNTGTTTNTGLYARNGAVTLDTNEIEACGQALGATSTPTPGVASTATSTGTTAATATAITATNTPIPIATSTSIATATAILATNTPVSVATNTHVVGATNTPILVATNTPSIVSTQTPANTQVPEATSTAVTNTAVPTSVATLTNTAVAINTVVNTPSVTITPSGTAISISGSPTSTATPIAPTGTSIQTETPTQTPGSTSTIVVPGGTPIGTPAITPTEVVEIPVPPILLPPSGGGFSWSGPMALLVGVLLLAAGLGVLRLSRRRLRNSAPPM